MIQSRSRLHHQHVASAVSSSSSVRFADAIWCCFLLLIHHTTTMIDHAGSAGHD